MLKSWSIENFKAIVNSGELKLAPVTILAGKNSSGKSSLIQSILMIAQTLSNQIPNRPLLPNERIVQLGTFEDIISNFTNSRTLSIRFELNEDKTSKEVLVNFSSANTGKNVSMIEKSKVVVEDVSISYNIDSAYDSGDWDYDSEEDIRPSLVPVNGKFVIKKVSKDVIEQYRKNNDENLSLSFSEEDTYYFGELSLFGVPFSINSKGYTYITSRSYEVDLFHFLPKTARRIFGKGLPDALGISDEANMESVVENIVEFFASKIRYLGPLRADPNTIQKRFAPTSQLDEVGYKGEYSAVVYDANKSAVIDWYNPNTSQTEQGMLQTALDTWVRYLDVAFLITTEMAGSTGIAWKVVMKEGQESRTLSNVGVGLSQILPILVMGLLSPEDSLLIMEQPELHLHPKVQAGLGDFFVGLAKSGKQCLIETHSENIVSQLRYQIVEAGGQDKSDCIIYFVDQDETGAAKFEPVEISPNGNILNWPDGFFDETMLQEDRITAASIKKRAKKSKNG